MCSPQGSHGITVRGSPIRTSTDRGMCAPPRRLSQITTSFLASARLGIHRVPLVACQPIRPICKLSQELECTHHCAHPISPSLGITSYSTVKEPRRSGRSRNSIVPLFASERRNQPLETSRSRENLVEVRGLEPLTPCLQNRCSAS